MDGSGKRRNRDQSLMGESLPDPQPHLWNPQVVWLVEKSPDGRASSRHNIGEGLGGCMGAERASASTNPIGGPGSFCGHHISLYTHPPQRK
jgi:hypothetical protein